MEMENIPKRQQVDQTTFKGHERVYSKDFTLDKNLFTENFLNL